MTPDVVRQSDDAARTAPARSFPSPTPRPEEPPVTLDQIYRAAARAGVAAACIGIPADLFHFTIESRAAASQSLAFRLHGVGLVTAFTLVLLALAGMVLAQQGRAGRLGLVGGLLALAGTSLVVGELAKEAFGLPLAPAQLDDPQGWYLLVVIASFSILTTGWVLTALACRRAGLLSRPATALLVTGALLALPPIPGAYVVLLIGVAVVASRLPAAATAAVPAPRKALAEV
jgi:hypothetical protein